MSLRFPLSTEYRDHLLLGLFLGAWLYAFLVLVGPFDAQEVSIRIRTILMVGYGMLFFISYALFIPIQNKIYQLSGKWRMGHEVIFVLSYCTVVLPICFLYYKTELVNGTYSFTAFTTDIYLPTVAILIPVIFIGRFLVARFGVDQENIDVKDEIITIVGEHKLDILKVSMRDLIGVEAANNYVAVHFLLDGQIQKKLLRTTLSKVKVSIPDLIQVHRSYLVNLNHFVQWKDSSSIVLTQLTVPVSKRYKSELLTMPTFAPK